MRPRIVARIARWEVTRGRLGVDRRTLAFGGALLLVLGLVAPVVLTQGVAVDRGIYRAGVPADSPYRGPLEADSTFTVHEPSAEGVREGRLDVAVIDGRLVHADSGKGRAAAAEFRRTIASYSDDRMGNEANRSAAFPVRISLVYAERGGREGFAVSLRTVVVFRVYRINACRSRVPVRGKGAQDNIFNLVIPSTRRRQSAIKGLLCS